ncbi:MAG TPA: hypothetical protein VIC26_15855 [Marinagarivorans sp.]
MFRSTCREWIAAFSLSFLLLSSLFVQTAYAIDFIAPQIEHNRATDSVVRGNDHLITANVTDDTAVKIVVLHYREPGTRDFIPIEMRSLDGSSHYEAVIVGQNVRMAGLEYFFEATDSAGNTLEMYGSNGEPFMVSVAQPDVALNNGALASNGINADGSALNQASNGSVLPVKRSSFEGPSKKTWLWVGLGVLAAAVIAGAAGGSGSSPGTGDPGGDNTGDLDITTPVPVN